MSASDELILRLEQPSDYQKSAQVIKTAFENSPYSDQQEHFIVETLRNSGVLDPALVAEVNNELVGFACASPIQVSDGASGWYGLGPIAVVPHFQRAGIGSMMVDEILNRLRLHGASGCVVLGDPDFYSRFGFEPDQGLVFSDFDPKYFQVIRFDKNQAEGDVNYHPAFYSKN